MNTSVFLSSLLFYLQFCFLQQTICPFSDTIDVQRPKTTREFIDAKFVCVAFACFYPVIRENCHYMVFINLS